VDKEGERVLDEDGDDEVEWLEHSVQPFCDAFWKREFHLYGKMLKSSINKWQQVIVRREPTLAGHIGELKIVEYTEMTKKKNYDTNFTTKPNHRLRSSEESFLLTVKKELAACRIQLPEHLPLRIDAYLEKRYGPHSLVATFNGWGNFPARDLEGVVYGSHNLVKLHADEMINYLFYHNQKNRVWP